MLVDPTHTRTGSVFYRTEAVLETWKLIGEPLIRIDGDRTNIAKWWGQWSSSEDIGA